ncbi:22266_t:CDS:1, partial [Gigaspora rosea]
PKAISKGHSKGNQKILVSDYIEFIFRFKQFICLVKGEFLDM